MSVCYACDQHVPCRGCQAPIHVRHLAGETPDTNFHWRRGILLCKACRARATAEAWQAAYPTMSRPLAKIFERDGVLPEWLPTMTDADLLNVSMIGAVRLQEVRAIIAARVQPCPTCHGKGHVAVDA